MEEIRDRFCLDASTIIPDSINKDIDEVTLLLKQGQQSITIAARNREEQQQHDSFADMDSKFKSLIDKQTEIDQQTKAFEKLRSHLAQNNKVQNPVEFYKKFKHEIKSKEVTTQDKYNKNQSYISFRQNIWNINHPDEIMPSLTSNDDDDIVVGPSKISLKCPITTTWFEDPVTSKTCNHTFSKAAIFGLIQGSGGYIECPIPGCDKMISKSTLVPDMLMADRVKRAKANANRQNQEFFDV